MCSCLDVQLPKVPSAQEGTKKPEFRGHRVSYLLIKYTAERNLLELAFRGGPKNADYPKVGCCMEFKTLDRTSLIVLVKILTENPYCNN